MMIYIAFSFTATVDAVLVAAHLWADPYYTAACLRRAGEIDL